MGIVYDSELYRATEKRFAPSTLSCTFESWHTDACFDNGYCATVFISSVPSLIDVHVIDAEGNPLVNSMLFFQPNEFKYATDGFDLRMGDNYCRGRFPNVEISVHDKEGNGVEWQVEALIQPTVSELPDGFGIGRVNTPTMPVSVGWYFLPWNRITGKLFVKGKEIPVSGNGWSDHQFGNEMFFTDACHYYYWGILPLGEHTLAFFESQAAEKGGYRPIKWLWDFKGDHLHEYLRNGDYYIDVSDIDEGDTVPKKLFLVFEHSRIRGTLTCIHKATMQVQPLDFGGRTITVNRGVYDCHAVMDIDGKKIDERFTRIMEAGF
jgi:hypothetical protein